MQFKPDSSSTIYEVLAAHQKNAQDWELHGLVFELQEWAERFNSEFKLEIPAISLRVDWLPAFCYGYFRRGRNGFGLINEIAINRSYLDDRQPWEVLGTLLHEMLHAWQETYGTPGKNNYHNKEFREKALTVGFVIDTRGVQEYIPDSPFFKLLERENVTFPLIEAPLVPTKKKSGASKLKKWSCKCSPPVNVRVAISDFNAKCLYCNTIFELQQK